MECRPAHASDLDRIIETDIAASQLYAAAPYDTLGIAASRSPELEAFYLARIAEGLCLVAEGGNGVCGFAAGIAHGADLFLCEVNVMPDHQKRGIGTMLIDRLCQVAAGSGMTRVVLSTFTRPPWNAPFYRRIGFADMARKDYAGWMERLYEFECRRFDISTRVFMSRPLSRTA